MTPQEHDLVTQLFDRLAGLETAPRDPDAERAIIEGLRRAPNAAYALVQTALVQDEALRRANARIAELTAAQDGEPPARPASFLDGMRDALMGRAPTGRGGSVPSVRPGLNPGVPPPGPSAGPAPMGQAPMGQAAMPPAGMGGSFLGTAASAAAGVIGGSLLLDGIRSMMGPHHGAFAAVDPSLAGHEGHSPWDRGDGGGDLARAAGIDDIGRSDQGGDAGNEAYDDGSGTDAAADADSDAGSDDGQFDSDLDDAGGGFDGGTDFGGGDFSGGGDFA